ncbi:YopX family protein [Bacillus sp. FSL R5-0560]|uniref:YopX family protein n=1 Tax=Bacillus sp. FSL R5-0560 TaxID=2954588 RepID=UPI0030CC3995
MKEIKFRSWIKDKKEMLYEFTLKQPTVSHCKKNILMQYTGLKDKKGQEIYEEDIIQTPFMKREGYAYRCVFSTEFGGYLFDPFVVGDKDAPVLGIDEFAQQWEEVKHGEVIGNTYENLKLLNN